ncbi:MAG: D-alanyl-D-alanine carboxypeptidase/D-alanyl-D-alanine-endopeptidase [Deltaproteobacteria bacterium]|nr:D-alanyl-D-alanine carboxypeptidase/D-alanyl-D-alanine-endopeptidase [Deltaproteobacteria bacterium]
MRRATIALAAAGLAAALCALPVRGEDTTAADHSALRTKLERLVEHAPWGDRRRDELQVGVEVLDLATGDVVYGHHADRALNPASNAKLLVMAAALEILGPAFTIPTTLHGLREGDTVAGDVVLRGHGDPTLTAEDLWTLAREARATGITRVRGGIRIDDAYFDDARLPYAYDSQPGEDATFRAPVGAASIDANAVEVWIGPGTEAGDPARFFAWPEGFLETNLEARTAAGGGNALRMYASAGADGATHARIWGSIGVGAAWDSYARRIDDPVRFAGLALREALRAAGIAVDDDRVATGSVPDGATVLARHESDPLHAWLWRLGKESSNFHAEQVLRILGAERRGTPGTADHGAEVVREVLEAWNVPTDGLVLRNGSGLFAADEVTPRTLTALLRAVYLDAALRAEFLAALAVAGRDGTLHSRLRDGAARELVRAKTGTLAAVWALSGYALSPDGRAGYAFSVLVNDPCRRRDTARALQDDLATTLAAELER